MMCLAVSIIRPTAEYRRAGAVLGKNIGGGLAPLNFPSSFSLPPLSPKLPSHPFPPFPFPLPPLSFFLIPSFPSLPPFLPLPPIPLEVGPLKSSYGV